ncbi:MAG: LamG domain-containing protein [Sediminibacterium sp.]|nr:LamG domain-containing protein [Sediminibacterium sp.]
MPSNSDSLFYYLPLNNLSNRTKTEKIPNSTFINNSSTWSGALNNTSRIISNGDTGAKYKYDSSRQFLSGTYKNALVANEKIQYSLNGGSSWKNVDTALNNLRVAKLPTTFRFGVVKMRSAILNVPTLRAFVDFTILTTPSAFLYTSNRIDVNERTINFLNVSSIVTGGSTVKYSISSGGTTGISIDSISGQIKVDSIVIFGLYNIVVTASNIQGSTTASLTINVKQVFKNRVIGFINNYFKTTTNATGSTGDYINLPTFVLDSNFTVETWFNLYASNGIVFPFIYNLGGWGVVNLSQGLIMASGINRTLDVMSWGVEANQGAPLDFTGFNIVGGTWVHLAVVVKGRNTKVYVNGNLIKQYLSIGVPSNNNTFTNNRISNGQSAGSTISTTLGKFQDFRVWKKARTTLEIQSSYLTPVPISSDSLYYNIGLNAPSIITTNNILNNTTLNNVSTWVGATNSTSTIVSQANTGAKYFYDTTRQRLYGTISSALILSEKIQYSINGGTTWTNVDTVFGLNWLVTMPITYKFATIKIRSSNNPTRVFQDFTFYSIPTISYSTNSVIDTFGTTGVSVVPTVSTSGTTTCSITSGG